MIRQSWRVAALPTAQKRMIIAEGFVAARIPSHRPPPGELRRSPPRLAPASPPRLGDLSASAAAHPKGAARFGPASHSDDLATAFWLLATSFAKPTTALTSAHTDPTTRTASLALIAGPFGLEAIMMACGGIWIPALVASGYQRWWHPGASLRREAHGYSDHGRHPLVLDASDGAANVVRRAWVSAQAVC